MIEEEAKTRWCPFARPAQVRPDDCGEVRGNRQMAGEIDLGALCIGSACMAWRWSDPESEQRCSALGDAPPQGEGWEATDNRPYAGDARFALLWRRLRPNRRGFCGLAGAPQ